MTQLSPRLFDSIVKKYATAINYFFSISIFSITPFIVNKLDLIWYWNTWLDTFYFTVIWWDVSCMYYSMYFVGNLRHPIISNMLSSKIISRIIRWQYVSIIYTKCLPHYPRHNSVHVSVYYYCVNIMGLHRIWRGEHKGSKSQGVFINLGLSCSNLR